MSARDLAALFGAGPRANRFPSEPATALAFAGIYRRLGGSFSIGSNGVRYFGRPEPCVFRMNGQDLPELPDALPHEKFHSAEEWRGAINLLEGLLSRIDDADSDMIYGLMAAVAIDDRNVTPSIDEPKRSAGQ